MKQLNGIHHVTAITSSAQDIYNFYNTVLGMRLVKKNVNQDDINTYHLFFADEKGSPGTDMTFFDFKGISAHQPGTNDIARTGFRVPSDQAISYWEKRFDHYQVSYQKPVELFGWQVIYFEDFDKQQYALFSDENDKGVAPGVAWHKGPVPDEYAIVGLGPVFLKVADASLMTQILEQILSMKQVHTDGKFILFEMGEGGNGASVILEEDKSLTVARQGFGGVHHVAFRVDDKDALAQWEDKFDQLGLRHSGFVDRFYFGSLYIRLYNNILFELATDGPGFVDDQESLENLGEKLTLPPHLRQHQAYVESVIKPFDTVRSTKVFEKEYFND